MATEFSIVPTAEPVDFTAGDPRLFADRAYHELRDRIVTLRLPPGTVLREDALMRELGVGRTPLREAVKRLALENLVAVQPRRGTFVSPVEASDIVHITEVRAELEGYAAELSALRMSAETRVLAQELFDEVQRLTRTDDQDGLMRFDERIHRFTWDASGNPFLIATLERYYMLSMRVWYLVLDRVPGLGHAVHDQLQLMEALVARNGPLARTIMREHVLAFQREIMAAFSRT